MPLAIKEPEFLSRMLFVKGAAFPTLDKQEMGSDLDGLLPKLGSSSDCNFPTKQTIQNKPLASIRLACGHL